MRVFISYSNDGPEHSQRVLELATSLRQDLADIEAEIAFDQFVDPDEGWPLWCEEQVGKSDRIVLVATPAYRRRYYGEEEAGKGLGASKEAALIRQRLYDEGFANRFCRAVVFDAEHFSCVPDSLRPNTVYVVSDQTGYQRLLFWLRGATTSDEAAPPDQIAWPQSADGFQWRLANRSEECATFERMVTAQTSKRAFLLQGPTGRGKTTLLSRFGEYAERVGLGVAHLDQKGCPDLDEVLAFLELDMGDLLPPSSRLAGGPVASPRVLAQLRRLRKPLALLFDTYEQASPDLRRWLENLLLPRLDKTPAIVVVVAGKETPNPSLQVWDSLAERVELRLIPEVEEWIAFIRDTWAGQEFPRQYVEAFALATAGDPGRFYALVESAVLNWQSKDSHGL